MTSVLTLLLADSRFPCGSHAHSGGLEAAVDAGGVDDLETLADFLRGRLLTAGRVAASFAAAAALRPGAEHGRRLDLELDARIASPALRAASRQQGRGLLRAARAAFGAAVPPWLDDDAAQSPHHAVALGAVAAGLGLEAAEPARIAAHGAVVGPATAAVRLLGLDPLAVAGVVAGLAGAMEAVVAGAVVDGARDPADLPCPAAPRLDIGAQRHAIQEVRLFAS